MSSDCCPGLLSSRLFGSLTAAVTQTAVKGRLQFLSRAGVHSACVDDVLPDPHVVNTGAASCVSAAHPGVRGDRVTVQFDAERQSGTEGERDLGPHGWNFSHFPSNSSCNDSALEPSWCLCV